MMAPLDRAIVVTSETAMFFLDCSSLRSGAVALLWLAATLLASVPAYAERRVALVIGNGAYTHAASLPNPSNDADAVGAALQRLRFDHVTVLKNLGAEAFRRALLDFEPKAAAADIAVVYFAGHGVEVDGQNFLVPVDARLVRAAAAELEAIPLSTVTSVLAPARKLRLVILDACRTNPFRARMAAGASAGRKRAVGRGLARIEPGENELIAFAAAAGTEADDGSGRQSPFVTALLKHIETPGLDVRIMFGRVRDEVLKATERQQTPHVYGTLGGEEIHLAALDAAKKPAPPPAPVPLPTAIPPASPPLPTAIPPPPRSSNSAWVKLCDRGQLKGKDAAGGEVTKAVDQCITLSEQIHRDTGMTMISAALHQVWVDGRSKQAFKVSVPQGVALSAGLFVTVFPRDLWEKLQKSIRLEKGDQARLKPVRLNFAECTYAGCNAEMEATADFVNALIGGAGLVVQTVRAQGTPVAQPLTLNGFHQALVNPPTDTKKFTAARQELLKEIAKRREQVQNELKKKQEDLNRTQPPAPARR
jgi:invasion protein IalB